MVIKYRVIKLVLYDALWPRVFIWRRGGGFEPPVPCGTQTFQACTIGHSDTSPKDNKNKKSQVFDNFHFNYYALRKF